MHSKEIPLGEISLSASSSPIGLEYDAACTSTGNQCNGVGQSDINNTDIGTTGIISDRSNLHVKSPRSKKVVISNSLQKLIMELVPVKIEWSQTLGRYLVATRDIQQSELIFQVQPIVAGPTPSYTEKEWICMSCFRATKKKTLVRCSDCQWPFCSKDCEEDDVHKDLECLVLAKAKVLPEDDYSDHITLMQLLRCLLIKNKDPEGWQQILSMESHVEGRKHSTNDVWERWRKEEIKFIHDTLGLKEFDEEEINFVSGVLSMNAFGSNDIHGLRHRHGSYLYYLGAMSAHDCSPNTDYEVDENQNFNLKAIVDIPKGGQITLSYALPFQGTLLRREYLKDYFFGCCCARCSDALEFGSYFSALKCSLCDDGVLLPDHPLAEESPWKCSESGCKGMKCAVEVNKILRDFDNLRESNEYASDTNDFFKNIDNLDRLLEQGRPLFHPNHFCLMGVEFELIQKIQYYIEIGKIPIRLNNRLLELTRKHIEIGQLIWPGWNDRYGRLLYLLQAGLLNSLACPTNNLENGSSHVEATENGEESKRKILKDVMRLRADAKKILLSKPRGSYEHSLGLKLKNIMSVEVSESDLVARVQKMRIQ